jgi:hypothetical protein
MAAIHHRMSKRQNVQESGIHYPALGSRQEDQALPLGMASLRGRKAQDHAKGKQKNSQILLSLLAQTCKSAR